MIKGLFMQAFFISLVFSFLFFRKGVRISDYQNLPNLILARLLGLSRLIDLSIKQEQGNGTFLPS
jgi:hypothetical protein